MKQFRLTLELSPTARVELLAQGEADLGEVEIRTLASVLITIGQGFLGGDLPDPGDLPWAANRAKLVIR